MGLRQALGLVFSEIWFAVRDEIKQGKEDGKVLFNSIALGVKRGLENAKLKYKELWHKFIEGAVGGVLASLTTTLCNIFFTTAKNVVRIIRQSWVWLKRQKFYCLIPTFFLSERGLGRLQKL